MDLSQIFNEGQFSLVKPGMDAFNLEQLMKQNQMEAAKGQEQRAQQMFPAELQSKQAYANQAQAQADTMQDARAAQLPPAERAALAMAEQRKKMTDAQTSEEDQKMYRRGQYAAMAMKNKGVLPLEYLSQLDENERRYFASPQAVQTTALLTKAWHDSHPKTMEARAKEQAALERAMAVARETTNRVNAKGAPKGFKELLATTKGSANKLAVLAQYLPAMEGAEKDYYTGVYNTLADLVNSDPRNPIDPKIDPTKLKDNGGKFETVPRPQVAPWEDRTPAPGVKDRPDRQAANTRVTIYKDGKAIGTVPLAQKEQAIKEGYTVK